MQRIEPYKCVAFEAPTSNGTRVRFVARVTPGLVFDAMNPVTGQLIGRISVWDANPEYVPSMRPRMLEFNDWTIDSQVQVEIVALDADGEFFRAVNNRVGRLGDMFDALLAITVVGEDRAR